METKERKTYAFLLSAAALDDFLAAWEAGTLPHSQWTHAAHVAVAACYAFDLTPADALLRTRRGIIHFNNCVGTPNTDTRGYHETLTRLWSGITGDCHWKFWNACTPPTLRSAEDPSYILSPWRKPSCGPRLLPSQMEPIAC